MRSIKLCDSFVLRRCSKEELLRKQLFWEFGKRAEVSGTWKFHVEDIKSCIVKFCNCFFTCVFKGLRANFLPSSYFSMNLLVRAGKIQEGGAKLKEWNKQLFQMLVMRSTISFPNGIGAQSRKYVVPGCFLPHLP